MPKSYQRLVPLARYAPWACDGVFVETYDRLAGFKTENGYRVKPRVSPALPQRHPSGAWAEPSAFTLVDRYRAFTIWSLVKQAAALPEGEVLEVGSWKGGSALLIVRCLLAVGSNARVYACDTYSRRSGMVKAGPRDPIYKNGMRMNAHLPTVADVDRGAALLGIPPPRILDGIFPEETGAQLQNARLRFCHIDVDVYESAKDSFAFVWPRLVSGGVVVFDDYGFGDCGGVTDYVDEAPWGYGGTFIYSLSGQAIVVKR
jgi:O-methyltransferase